MDYIFNKDKFIEQVNRLALFGENEKGLTTSIRKTELEIEKLKGKIGEIENDLIMSVIMTRSKKARKLAEIEEYEKEIKEKQGQIREIETGIRNLSFQCFGSEEAPSVYLGEYPQGPNGEVEPLEWDVLLRKNNRALLVTKHVIDQMKYAEELVDTPWKKSIIREYLNEEFFDKYFSAQEKAIIIEKEVPNPANESYHTAASDNTLDKVFLPSIMDVKRFSEFDNDRIAYPTEYAKAKGLYVNEETGGSYWWLRSNGGNMYNAAIVNFNGYVFDYGFYVNSERYGIRPNIWISLEK